jgi:hypothetical protein
LGQARALTKNHFQRAGESQSGGEVHPEQIRRPARASGVGDEDGTVAGRMAECRLIQKNADNQKLSASVLLLTAPP